jgi:hypothetical protein
LSGETIICPDVMCMGGGGGGVEVYPTGKYPSSRGTRGRLAACHSGFSQSLYPGARSPPFQSFMVYLLNIWLILRICNGVRG